MVSFRVETDQRPSSFSWISKNNLIKQLFFVRSKVNVDLFFRAIQFSGNEVLLPKLTLKPLKVTIVALQKIARQWYRVGCCYPTEGNQITSERSCLLCATSRGGISPRHSQA
jgi:hypothetical protein